MAKEELVEQRRVLHQQLLLPPDRPLLLPAYAVNFSASSSGEGPQLQNVHEGLGPSGVAGGKTHLVWGTYSYYHYMQVCAGLALDHRILISGKL